MSGSQPAWRLASYHQAAQREVGQQQAVELLLGQVGPAASAASAARPGSVTLSSAKAPSLSQRSWYSAASSAAGRFGRIEQRGDQPVQRLGIRHTVQAVVDDPDRHRRPRHVGGARARATGGSGTSRRAGACRQGRTWLLAQPPQQVGARWPRPRATARSRRRRGRPGTACRAAAAPAARAPAATSLVS